MDTNVMCKGIRQNLHLKHMLESFPNVYAKQKKSGEKGLRLFLGLTWQQNTLVKCE